MKNKIFTSIVITVIALSGFTAGAQEDKKSKEARKNVAEANQDLIEAKADSAADFTKFKKDTEIAINENEMKIAALKAKKKSDDKELNKTYNEKVSALEKKNNVLKKKMQNSGKTKTSKWSSFKTEFNREMEELGLAIKDAGMGNTTK